jgi:hypothetical protein
MKRYLALVMLPAALVLGGCGSSQPEPAAEAPPTTAEFLLYSDAHTTATHAEALALATVTCSELRQGTDIETVLMGGYAIMGDQARYIQGPAIATFCPEYTQTLTNR